jgi:hypothetical protein
LIFSLNDYIIKRQCEKVGGKKSLCQPFGGSFLW